MKDSLGQNADCISMRGYTNPCVALQNWTFYFKRGCSWCCVIIIFWQHHFHWHSLGLWIRKCSICHSSIMIPVWKDFIHGILLSCWAKWWLVMGQTCSAGSAKFCEVMFHRKLFNSESTNTNRNIIFIYLFWYLIECPAWWFLLSAR